MSMNLGIRQGNLVNEPELNKVNGTSVVRFTIAVNRKYKNREGEWVRKAAFIHCEAWDKGGEMIAQYFRKGDPIIIHEEITQDDWTDKNTGEKRSRLIFRVTRFDWVDGYDYEAHCWPGKEKKASAPAPRKSERPRQEVAEDPDQPAIEGEDDIPF